ncbi:MAG TPA: hypothetical protein VFS34_17070 [Thermoanaerobaculia bacterium]|nr:hypothetical protein [Thermoanaerobaculia bacterium]
MKRLLLVALFCAGCATTIAPGAEKIRITTNPKDVEGCKPVGSVDARGPFNLPDDWERELQNQALGLGADVVFRTGPLAMTDHVSGVAYRCQQPKP